MNAAEWNRELSLVGSEDRARVLVAALDGVPSRKAKAALLREWFNLCDAQAPYRVELWDAFAAVGWVTDVEDDALLPEFPVTVYRAAWEDDEIEDALSWTTSREVAERFARGLTSMRARFLGIYRDDVEPWIWQATAESAYAYFNDRGEHEVVPQVLTDVEPIAVLRTVTP